MQKILGETFTDDISQEVLQQADGDLDISLDLLIPNDKNSSKQAPDCDLERSKKEIKSQQQPVQSSQSECRQCKP